MIHQKWVREGHLSGIPYWRALAVDERLVIVSEPQTASSSTDRMRIDRTILR